MEERMAMASQMKEVDKASMDEGDYIQSLLDILNADSSEESETDSFSVYA
jgi:hypothetical protein